MMKGLWRAVGGESSCLEPRGPGGDPGLRTPARVSSPTPSGSRMDTRRGLPDIESHRDLHIWIIEVSGTTRQKNWRQRECSGL